LARSTGDGGAASLPLEDDLASADPARERAVKIRGMVQRVNYGIDQQLVHRKLLFELSLDTPVSVSMDSSLDPILVKVDPARDSFLQVMVGRATEQASTVGDLVLAEGLLLGETSGREHSGQQAHKEGTHYGNSLESGFAR
jgi:hypothetical protein